MNQEQQSSATPSRREAMALSLTVLTAAEGAQAAPQKYGNAEAFPEEYWKERMQPPADGKKYGWVVDTRRCFGCHACEVACKAENDVPLGSYIRQTIYHDFQRRNGQMARIMVPMSCQHCEDAPCIKVCPCGALSKQQGGTVQIDYDRCCGHASCVDACPYGAIYIDPVVGQAVKCHNCTHRVDEGMEPACVSTCPSEALYFGDLNDPKSKVSQLKAQLDREENLQQLRVEKGTKPRMYFAVNEDHPMEEWQEKIPGEGESYSQEAYSIYNWKKKKIKAAEQKKEGEE